MVEAREGAVAAACAAAVYEGAELAELPRRRVELNAQAGEGRGVITRVPKPRVSSPPIHLPDGLGPEGAPLHEVFKVVAGEAGYV